jgi:hypothetical protein
MLQYQLQLWNPAAILFWDGDGASKENGRRSSNSIIKGASSTDSTCMATLLALTFDSDAEDHKYCVSLDIEKFAAEWYGQLNEHKRCR